MDSSNFLLLTSYHPHFANASSEKKNIHESQGSIYKWDLQTGAVINTTPHQDYHPPQNSQQSLCMISVLKEELFEEKKTLSTLEDPMHKPFFLGINERTSSLNYYTHSKVSPFQRYHIKEKGICCVESGFFMKTSIIWASTKHGHLMAWNRINGSLIFTKPNAHLQRITAIKIIGDGTVLTSSMDGFVKLWSISSKDGNDHLLSISSPNNEGIQYVDVGFGLGRNRRIITCSGDLVSVFDLIDGKLLFSISVPLLSISSFASFLQREIFAATKDGKIYKFSIGANVGDNGNGVGGNGGNNNSSSSFNNNNNINMPFEGHKGSIITAMTSVPSMQDCDGFQLVTGDSSGEVIVWSSKGEILKRLPNPIKEGKVGCNQIIAFTKSSLSNGTILKAKHAAFKTNQLENLIECDEELLVFNDSDVNTNSKDNKDKNNALKQKLKEIELKYQKLKDFVDENV